LIRHRLANIWPTVGPCFATAWPNLANRRPLLRHPLAKFRRPSALASPPLGQIWPTVDPSFTKAAKAGRHSPCEKTAGPRTLPAKMEGRFPHQSAPRLLGACAFLAVLLPSPASAAPSGSAAQCVRDANEGQTLRDEGKLLQAREELARCAAPQCPKVVAAECRRWLEELGARIPTVVVVLQDASGADITPNRVLIDGEPSSDAASGRAVSLDPGLHSFRSESDGGSAERKLVVRERESGQKIVLVLPPKAAPKATPIVAVSKAPIEYSRPVPVLSWVAASVGVVAAGVGTGFAVDAASRFGDLTNRCPDCADSEVADLRTRSSVADVAFAVAIVTASVAVIAYLARPTLPRRSQVALVSF